jgi:hypothetical protein
VDLGGEGRFPMMLAAGMINAWGVLTLQRAMRRGHHGVTWAIGQSAMVVPFLVGVLVFGDALGALGFPIAVGACVVGFGIYSAVVLHETFTRWHLVGMTLGVVGVVCVASSR